ncbi:MAG: methylmalonyl Co-A mutase-associated GTPase MeaB, partial [Thermodesulfobacteriota bacterium]
MKTQLVEKVLAGNAQAAARLMRDIDDNIPGTSTHLKHLYPHTGHAHIIGLTGAPGAGKSTLMDNMIQHLRGQGKNIGVLAIDPTSPYSGGAILGDRIRMQRHANDSGVFIKSIATRGHMGGLSQSAFGITAVMEAMGKEVVLIETVGVGQDEVDIIRLAHTTIVVVTPGMGDGIQAVKSGILETADIYAINKADLEGAETTRDEIKMMLGMRPAKFAWVPPVVVTVASRGQGIDELLLQVKNHWNSLEAGGLEDYRRQKVRTELVIHFRRLLLERALSDMAPDQKWQDMVESVLDSEIDPLSAAAELVEKVL